MLNFRGSKRVLTLLVAAAFIITALSACGSNSSPKAITQKYFNAVKAGDLDKAIECFTPSVQAQYKASLAISNALFGVDSGALLGGLVGLSNAEAYSNYEFKVSDTKEIDETHATVTVDVYVDGSKTRSTSISCVRIGDDWFVDI